ncbi:MAG: trypsin-like peptidase domain-containing protein, partial [Burkholderiales bacterium]|nr:trypsin-like peptidase domain-containing protein [Burkholderiales bacterium]
HIVTNYHVVSQFALRPSQYRLVFATADGRQGALQLLDVDVVHDLALLRVADPAALAGRGALAFRPAGEPLQRGERIYSLGNPLDVGFAVVGGAYNGLAERSFLPTIFFGGSISAGMSGGPALDDAGRVIGINVATRRDGEQVSFLVPAAFAQALLLRSRDARPVGAPLYARISAQLAAHQQALVDAFIALPWRPSGQAHYRVPVPQERFMRCWGSSTAPEARGLQFERSDCAMDSRVFVNGSLLTGYLVVRHEAYDGRRLGWLRFADRYSKSFRNEGFAGGRQQTAPQCRENYVQGDGLALRAVLCLREYKKLPGLFDLALLVATLDAADSGVQGRFDAFGISFDNAQRLAAHYLAGFGVNRAVPVAPTLPQAPPDARSSSPAAAPAAANAQAPAAATAGALTAASAALRGPAR